MSFLLASVVSWLSTSSPASLFVDDLDTRVAAIAERGLQPATRETYGNGVRKITYRDPDGNEIGLGGAPV